MSTATPPPAPTPAPPPAPEPAPDLKSLWARAALFMAAVGVLGSLHLSLGMDPPLKACPLCYYQRSFIMATAAILLLGMILPGVPAAAVTVFALAPAFAGAYIAGQHAWMVSQGDLECPMGVTGRLVAPVESLIVFALLMIFLLGDLYHRGTYIVQGAGALLLGYLFATTGIRATSPMPMPTTPYGEKDVLDICRKPFQEKK